LLRALSAMMADLLMLSTDMMTFHMRCAEKNIPIGTVNNKIENPAEFDQTRSI